MQRLAKAGTDHRKFMRMMPVYIRITAPLYWWKEFDTYKVGTVANSCSTMHKIMDKEFTLEDFSVERMSDYLLVGVEALVDTLNTLRDLYINYDKYDNPETPKQKIWDSVLRLSIIWFWRPWHGLRRTSKLLKMNQEGRVQILTDSV